MFLVFLEIPIVITALIAITTELKGFESVSWLVASYLLGYTGKYLSSKNILLLLTTQRMLAVIVIFAKFSDLVGRKLMLLVSAAFFVIFSAACGASQTMVQV